MTKITDAYRQWSNLWRDFPTDEEEEAAAQIREPLEEFLAHEPAASLVDVVCKLKMFRAIADGGDWIHEDEVLADAIACLERLAGGAASG